MGFFKDIKTSFNIGRQRAIDGSYRRRKEAEKSEKVDLPIELVQPNSGRFVTLKVKDEDATDEFIKDVYMKQLCTYARVIKKTYPETVITEYDDRVRMELDAEHAEAIRSYWQNRIL